MTTEQLQEEVRECDRLFELMEVEQLTTHLVPDVMRKINGRQEGLTERDCMVILNVMQRWLSAQRRRTT